MTYLLNAKATTGAGDVLTIQRGACTDVRRRRIQAYLSATTTPAATVDVYGSLVSATGPWDLLDTFILSGSGATDSIELGLCSYMYAHVTAISGTSATVSCVIGE